MAKPSETEARVKKEFEKIERLKFEINKVIVGQDAMISRLMIALLTGQHVLLEGVPGLAKTTAVKALADGVSVGFKRIQFTPDLLPSDLIGTQIYQPSTGSFSTRKGPLFSNIILADEINRAPAKVQSALLEAMQEHQITIADETYKLAEPFLVLATQNPIEQEGTYPLPEAQVDRFMLKVVIGYPTPDEERKIVDLAIDRSGRAVEPVLSGDDISAMRDVVQEILIVDKVRDYAVSLVGATRAPEKVGLKDMKSLIDFGASPRASIFLCAAARANAFLDGRGYVSPQDVKDVALDVLRHRVIVSYEAEAREIKSDEIITKLLNEAPVP
ncbi:MAG: MoxR family ATPase [Planctomycetota bacterium]